MSRILHLEMPRGITFTMRPLHASARRHLSEHGVELVQRDLNVPFWRELLDRDDGLLASLVDHAAKGPTRIDLLRLAVSRIAEAGDAELRAGVAGLEAPADLLASTVRMVERVEAGGDAWLRSILRSVLADVRGAGDWDIVSFGVTSPESLYLALVAARELGARHVTIGHHHYENFTLLNNIDRVVAAGALFRVVDSVVLYEERMAEALLGLTHFQQTGDASHLENVAIRLEDGVVIQPPGGERQRVRSTSPEVDAAYVTSIGGDPSQLVPQIDLVGNKCYYRRCTFCVQITRHLSDRYYDEASRITDSVETMSRVAASGVGYFSITDEALRPKDIALFCDELEKRGLRIQWCARAIADAGMTEGLIDRMGAMGCKEVLFGLETIHPETAAAMGKISARAVEEDVFRLLDRFRRANIDVVLSLIRDFPTEDEEALGRTMRFVETCRVRYDNIFYIFNRFSLFAGTPIHADPQVYGISQLSRPRPEHDLLIRTNYRDRLGRLGFETEPRPDLFALQCGLDVDAVAVVERSGALPVLHTAAALNYGSPGLLYRAHWRRYPLHDAAAALVREVAPT